MQVSVLFFAGLRSRVGSKQVWLEIPTNAQVGQFRAILREKFPDLEPLLATALVAINRAYAGDDEWIPEGAEIAVFPPVSGGSDDGAPPAYPTLYAITNEVLDLDALVEKISGPETGAVCMFTGIVRGLTSRGVPRQTEYLEYEAYQAMGESKMRQVAEEIRRKWPAVQGIAIVQRIGVLYPGTPTVLIACSAAHRDTGVFEAARYGIDRLKEIVPIWKKEVGSAGEKWLEGEYIPDPGE